MKDGPDPRALLDELVGWREGLIELLHRMVMADCVPDVRVIESGTSPLEPCNGATALARIRRATWQSGYKERRKIAGGVTWAASRQR